MRFGKIKIFKKESYDSQTPRKSLDVNVDTIDIAMLTELKKTSNYLFGYLGNVIRPFDLILTRLNEYVKNFKDNDTKLMSFCIYNNKLLEPFGQRFRT